MRTELHGMGFSQMEVSALAFTTAVTAAFYTYNLELNAVGFQVALYGLLK